MCANGITAARALDVCIYIPLEPIDNELFDPHASVNNTNTHTHACARARLLLLGEGERFPVSSLWAGQGRRVTHVSVMLSNTHFLTFAPRGIR